MATQIRTPAERTGAALCPRDAAGRLLRLDPLQRFVQKCCFDPATGCVLWTGGTTAGRGNSAVYGSFWDDGRRWFAHRWSGVHIHGLDLAGYQAGHNCPHGPNTLCVQHVVAQTQLENITEMNERLGGPPVCRGQSNDERQHWLFVSLGLRELAPESVPSTDGVPFYLPPAWLLEARGQLTLDGTVKRDDDCPF